jgi:hypothetical protein
MPLHRALFIVVLAFFLPFAACARSRQPAASVQQVSPSWLAGSWQFSGSQVGAADSQFQRDTMITFASDGTWKAAAGGYGTSSIVGDQVVLDGVTKEGEKVRFTLRQRQGSNIPELWGPVAFRGNTHEVTLRKVR